METQESSGSGGFFGLLGVAVAVTGAAVASIWRAMTRDGTLAAFVRQGADEMGMALKAFPDSISVDEPGTVLNPTQGEIAADRKPRLPSPSDIAKDKHPYTPDHSQGNENDHGRDR